MEIECESIEATFEHLKYFVNNNFDVYVYGTDVKPLAEELLGQTNNNNFMTLELKLVQNIDDLHKQIFELRTNGKRLIAYSNYDLPVIDFIKLKYNPLYSPIA